MKIDPTEYQEEEKQSFDLSLTREEKMKLIAYLACIALGIALLFGLIKSGDVVASQVAKDAIITNLTQNVTINITGV